MINIYTKYPRTPHLPWSEGIRNDDRVLKDVDHFKGKIVVVTEKLDGENTNMYHDHIHARSLDSKDHPSRHWVKGLHAGMCHNIPKSIRLCGENVFAKHSIFYNQLESYFYLFGAFKENRCVNWTCIDHISKTFKLALVPVLYIGEWDENEIRKCYTGVSKLGGEQEGYVVRLIDGFQIEDFGKSVAKFVRKDHVTTDNHNWLRKEIIKNELRR